jgi:hypothetical protein
MKIQTITLSISTSERLVIFYNFIIYYLKLKNRLANDEDLSIKLSIHPSTIEELALIRFWLLKLSQTHFKEFDAYYCILNPEFLSVLNQRTGPRKILFHANVQVDEYEIPADFVQFICARRINLSISNLDEPHRDNIFKFIMGTRNTIEKFHIRSFEAKQGEFCEFLVKVYFEIHFYNFQL